MFERLAAALILGAALALGAAVIAAVQIRQTGWVRGGKMPEDAAPHVKRLKQSAAVGAGCLAVLALAWFFLGAGP